MFINIPVSQHAPLNPSRVVCPSRQKNFNAEIVATTVFGRSGLVRKSALICLVPTLMIVIISYLTHSIAKFNFTSISLHLAKFLAGSPLAQFIAPDFSWAIEFVSCLIPNSCWSCHSHTTTEVHSASAIYSASEELRAIGLCPMLGACTTTTPYLMSMPVLRRCSGLYWGAQFEPAKKES